MKAGRNFIITRTLALAIAAATTASFQSSAATLYVSQTSPEPTPPYSNPETAAHNIQDAVDVATDGDTVLVAPGDYGVTNQITVTKAVRLQSTGGTNQTFLTGYGSYGTWCLMISNALAVADGFTFGSGTGASGGANLYGGTIQNCNFTNFYAGLPGAIVMNGGTVSNALVTYIRGPQSQGAAVYCSDSGLVTDSLILCNGTVGFGGRAIALANSRLQNSVISGAGGALHTSGVAVYAISSTIVGCTISNNYSLGQGGGAYLQDSLMDRCIVTGNTAGGSGGGGIFETNSIIRDSLIVGNGAVAGDGGAISGGLGGGVHMQGGALLNCTVSKNTAANSAGQPGAGAGIYVEGNGTVTNSIIYFNSFSGNSGASSNWFNAGTATFDHSCTAPDPGGAGNIAQDPQFVNATNGNFHLASSSPCIDAGTNQSWMTGAQDLDGNPRIRGPTVDIGAYETPSPAETHYVSQTSPNPTPPYSTPETAAHKIQDAVDVATDGDTVLVAPGDYVVTNQIIVTKGIRLQSTDGPSQTFLTASGGPHTWCLAISNALAVADGFSFRPKTPSPGYPGGAILVGGIIQNCNFTNFFSTGGAIQMSGGVVSNVIVAYNRGIDSSSAAVYCSDSGLVTDSQILANPAVNVSGGAIFLMNSRLQNSVISGVGSGSPGGNYDGSAVSAISSTVVGCTISNNYSLGQGAGANLQDSLMDRCIVTGNTVGCGGFFTNGGGGIFETNSIIRNSLIVSNQAIIAIADPIYGALGAGVYMQGGALLNCTVTGNSAVERSSAAGGGGGVFAESGGITNCIIYFNSVDNPQDAYSASSNWFNLGPAVFDHCCTAPDPGGAGNITQDPQFADMANGNYHLASTSPCIGAGVVQPWMTGAQDLDGNPRTTNGRVDLGAYQNQSSPPSILSIARSGSNVVLRWPSAGTSGLILENSQDLTTPEGWTPTGATVSDEGTNKFVTLPATNNAQFFRLR